MRIAPITPKVLFSKSNEANSSSDIEESSKLFNLTPSCLKSKNKKRKNLILN